MSPQAISKLRHSLRTPLNHIIGYAEMVREDAAGDANLMDDVRTAARRIVDAIQAALAAQGTDEELALLRSEMAPYLEQILAAAAAFGQANGTEFAADLEKIRAAAHDLMAFARGGELPEPDAASPRAAHAPRSSHTAARILVVDDDEGNREILSRRLEREGFAVDTEGSGEAALARLRRERFDLLLLDLLMPGMNGFEVLSQLKADPKMAPVPVVVLSALDDIESAVRSIEMGAEDFLAKPFDPVLLRARIGAIMKRRQVEAERTELAESLELLLQSTGEGVWGVDRAGKCTFINRAALEMLGYSREELLGRDLHAVLHHTKPDGSQFPYQECPMHVVLDTGEPRRSSSEMLFRTDGSSFPVEYAAHPIRRDGAVEGVVVTFADISERKRSEEHLLQSAKLESLGVLAGGLAHDFNNILTGILGNASLVLESIPQSDDNHELLEEVVRASERAADLTRQMLAFAGKGRFVVEPVDLSKSIEEIAELLETSLPKPVKLSLQLARSLPPVEADQRQVQQLIFNLVINGGEAIGERPGLVLVETGVRDLPKGEPGEPPFGHIPPGRYVYVAVQDTGEGMDEATRARIFEPFFSTKFTGRGLGLPAAMGIVRSHRGAIRVESEPARGSRFEVLLPVKVCAATAHGGRTILVVDDEEIVRRTTRSVLERKGYHVILAENGQQAIEVFREKAPEIALIVLDLNMPVMGGEEAARHLHTIRHEVPILVSSGYNENEVARRFAGSRVKGYVRKPYTSAALLEKIRAAMGE